MTMKLSEDVKNIAELLANSVTAITLIAVLFSYLLSRRQAHFSVIEKCINDFRGFEKNDLEKNGAFKVYIDLVNEELFYLEKGYLPYDIAVEWMDGMIDYLPFVYNGRIINAKLTNGLHGCDSIEELSKIMSSYPRVANFITVKKEVDFNQVYSNDEKRFLERSNLINNFLKGSKMGFVQRWLFKRQVEKYSRSCVPPRWL